MVDAYEKFEKVEVQTPLSFDIPIVRQVGLYDRAKELFEARGFGFVFDRRPAVFPEVTREFLASFGMESLRDDGGEWVKYEWTFRLGSKEYVIRGRQALARCLMMGRGEPREEELSNAQFWAMITGGGNYYQDSRHESKEITDPWWKFIHYVIATNVFMRIDHGRWVNSGDVSFMNFLNGTSDCDLLGEMADHLLSHKKGTFKKSALGGGNVATLVAEHVGYILDPEAGLKEGVVQQGSLTKKGIIKKVKGRGWITCEVAIERVDEEAPEEPPRPRRTGGPPPNGDLAEMRDRLTTMERQVSENSARLRWQEGAIMSMCNHFQIPGVEPFVYEPEEESDEAHEIRRKRQGDRRA